MNRASYSFVQPHDHNTVQLISEWYLKEWNIPTEKTKEKLKNFSPEEFQVIMLLDGRPVATGGIYHRVGLVEREPRFALHQHWLALVFTLPEKRGKGLGARLCEHIQQQAKEHGLKELYLFTHTAETLYQRLGWTETERLEAGGKNIVVMKKELTV